MFNNHTMSLVTDVNLMLQEARNIDFITVAAITTGQYPEGPNIFYAGILVPPTEMLMRWADGDYEILNREYPYYLQTQDCDEMIVAIIAAMTKKNVILYIPHEEFDVYGASLLNWLFYEYGIVVNTPTTMFSLDPSRIPLILSKFYMLDIMDAKDYLAAYPWTYSLPDIVINKLAMEIRPFDKPATFEQYKQVFNEMVASKCPSDASGKKLLFRVVLKDGQR